MKACSTGLITGIVKIKNIFTADGVAVQKPALTG